VTFVVSLGDSISHGIGDSGPECVGPAWGGRVSHRIDAREHRNLSFPGAQSGHLLHLQVPAAVWLKPDLALISIGGNDVLRSSFDPLRVAHDLKASIARLDAVGTQVVVLGLPDPRRTVPAPRLIRTALSRRTAAVNAALEHAVAGSGALLLRMWDNANSYHRSLWHIDRMHPSPKGHEYLASLVITKLGLESVRAPLGVEPTSGSSALWLLRNGSVWCAKRSVDLLPGLLRMAIEHINDRSAPESYRLPVVSELPELSAVDDPWLAELEPLAVAA
jgi:lysophospholipase L1-like esterase